MTARAHHKTRPALVAVALAATFACPAAPAEEQAEGERPDDWTDIDPAVLADAENEGYESTVRGYELRPTDETTSSAETIDVEAHNKGFTSVSEVVSDSPGVQVRQAGGSGSYSAVSIRGSTPSQVPVYLDGVPLNIGGTTSINLGDLPLDTLERIEIYRGSSPLDLGRPGIGGAIHLFTRPIDRPVDELAASYGSFGSYRLHALSSHLLGNVGWLAVLSAEGSKGDYEFLNRNGTLFNEDDDRIERRANNAHASYNALLKADARRGAWLWTGAEDLTVKRQGIAGMESVPTETTSLGLLRSTTSLSGAGPIGDLFHLRLGASYSAIREELDDSAGEVGLASQRTRSRTDDLFGRIALTAHWSDAHRSIAAADLEYERFSYEELQTDYQAAPSSQIRAGLGIEHDWQATSALLLTAIARGDLLSSRFEGGSAAWGETNLAPRSADALYASPNVGARIDIASWLFARATAGRSLRTPTLAELFGDRGSVVGNPDLDPEVGWNADAGLVAIWSGKSALDLVRIDGGWFGSRVDDLITYVQNSQNTIRPENISSASIQGIETSLRIKLLDAATVDGNYTYLHAVDRSSTPYTSGRRLPGRPEHSFYGRFLLEEAFQRFEAGGWLDLDWSLMNHLDRANLKTDEVSRALLGFGARLAFPRPGLTATVEIRNLLDTVVLYDKEGNPYPLRDFEAFPLPGRTFLFTLHWRIGGSA